MGGWTETRSVSLGLFFLPDLTRLASETSPANPRGYMAGSPRERKPARAARPQNALR